MRKKSLTKFNLGDNFLDNHRLPPFPSLHCVTLGQTNLPQGLEEPTRSHCKKRV